MLPAVGVLEQARRARDPRFDGRFFIGVRTTGIYCRPVCPVKMPHAENVTFFASAAAAAEAGTRPGQCQQAMAAFAASMIIFARPMAVHHQNSGQR